ncbi:iron uptake system protein EfeO [Paenibacillus sp. HB172176]|uniref:iron uptake system protein EfeO n=1 Tax=Paenibacillus sp. HB172176 TaxID=2493690 RepID=UPI00143A5AB9|nr:iron uptake system protein EfeO [Paenibacillus sp. HB172176]
MRKQLTGLILASTLVFAGCGNNNKEVNAPAGNSGNTDQTVSQVENWDPIIEQYRQFSLDQADQLVIKTEEFVKAVNDGDVDAAKSLYAPTRMYYERIEPIAEALGDFDPNIDARENDVEEKDWRGFHRLEQGLWVNGTTEGMKDYADRLLADVQSLRALMETVEIDPSMLVTGAVELLNEVSSSKVVGEEERYSHTDLYDFVANVEGAEKIYELVHEDLKKQDAELDKQIAEGFANLNEALTAYEKDGGYVSYEELKEEDTKKLSQLLDALAEPLSQMGVILGA